MQLTIQHLSIAKRNSEQVLALAEENINWSDLPTEALCENDQISFHLILESAVDNIFLIIGDREYIYTRSEFVGSGVRYSWISHYLKSHVPCKNISLNKIHLTERIKKDRNYFGFFKVVKSWQIDKEVDWRPERLLININSADKLFEVYCCASINSYLYRVGKSNAIKKGLFDGVILNHQINLKYEPIFWKAGHRNSINQPYLNTDMDYKYASQSQRSSESGKYLNRRPDYVIEFMNLESGEKKLIILDAKYMKPEIASDQLAPLVMKYVHGIHASSGENVVDGLLILHPENLIEKNSTGKYIDHHAYPYDLYSGKAVRPILGLQSIVLSRDGVEQKLFETLDLIFSILVHDSKLRAVV